MTSTHVFKGDLPADVKITGSVAIDTETTGLNLTRDRLCLVQMADASGKTYIVQIAKGQTSAPNLVRVLTDKSIKKLFHYGRFDIAIMKAAFDALCVNVYCTKTASRLCRTFTDRHGLKDLCKDLLGISISKQEQTSDWGADTLTGEQLAYAASDVIHLHALKAKLDEMLARENRTELAQKCFDFLPVRAELDLAGWPDFDIFAH
ncbi:MAG: ribonuclease D [Bdellovibrionales bacterium]